MSIGKWSCLIAGFVLVCGAAPATEIVYTPVNPSFGGNPANGPLMMNSAQAQDTLRDPSFSSAFDNKFSNVDSLAQQLQGVALSNLTSRISGGTLRTGTFTIGTTVISLTPVGSNVRVTITDLATGGSTVIDLTPTP
jgi:curli production assembly/transport component CsgF